jgi:uncharacterized membrane-anchored protein
MNLTTPTDLPSLIKYFTDLLVGWVVPLLVALAVVGFVYGVIQYFLYPDNEEKRKNGKTFMLWGLIALFVMVSIWGLVGILATSIGVKAVIPGLPV